MGRDQKVQVFSLGLPKAGTPKDRRRYRVKWRVDGHHKTRSFKTKAQADRLRSSLLQAVRDGLRFDQGTGEPEQWSRLSETWWSWSAQWYDIKWPGWAGKSRKSGAEPLVAITPHLLRARAPEPNFDLTAWLWEVGYRPNLDDKVRESRELAWLERWSLPLVDITPDVLEPALQAATTKRDGSAMVTSVIRKRRDLIKAVFSAAVLRDLIDRNPMDRIIWRAPSRSVEVDINTVPTVADVRRAAEVANRRPGYGAHYASLFLLVGLAGLRPSEAARLKVADLDLPPEGWGVARAPGATTAPGTRYTDDGAVREDKALKHRDPSAVRPIPLPPMVVEALADHIERWPHDSGRLFTNGNGRPITPENWGGAWRQVRSTLWKPDHHLRSVTVYDLRHTAATTMLRAGVAPAEVARRLGHSVEMLMRVYAGVFEDDTERGNGQIDDYLSDQ